METDAATLLRQAAAALKARDREACAGRLAALIAARPRLGEGWGPVVRLAKAIGETGATLLAMRAFAAHAPDDPRRQIELAAMLAEFGRMEEALELGEAAAARWPASPVAQHFLGVALAHAGRLEAGAERLRRAIALGGAGAESWLMLCALKRFSPGDPDLARLTSALQGAGGRERATLLYAKGKALEDGGDVEGAFGAYNAGAELFRAAQPYDPAPARTLLEDTRAGFDQAFLARLRPSAAAGARAIFVLGPPRSGTTLVQEILAAHSRVGGGGELGLFRHAAMALADFKPASIAALDARGHEAWTAIARGYHDLLAQRFGPHGLIVDKTLSHAMTLGLIAHILPEARFIWLKRTPGAVAWSCFRTRFSQGMAWSWSLAEIGAHLRVLEGFHAHWRGVLGERLLSLDYEALVHAPDLWTKRLLAHAGLDDEEGTRRFHENARVVQTSSMAQVREPVHARAVDAWRAYEGKLAPFFERWNA